MPQIAQFSQIYASQLFWLLVIFGLVYFGIGRAMLPKIEATIDQRDHRIAEDLAAAGRARATAEATEADYSARIAEARAVAQRAAQAATASAAAETEAKLKVADEASAAKLAAAEAQLNAARTQALAQIETVAADATRDIVARLAGLAIDEAAVQAATRAALEAA